MVQPSEGVAQTLYSAGYEEADLARLRLISREEMAPDKQPIYDRIAATRGSVANVFKALLNSPDAAAAVGGLGKYLRFSSSLDPAIREVCILSTAKELDNGYEWAQP